MQCSRMTGIGEIKNIEKMRENFMSIQLQTTKTGWIAKNV